VLPAIFRRVGKPGASAAEIEAMIDRLIGGVPAAGQSESPPVKDDRLTGASEPDDYGPDEARYRDEVTRAIERAYMKDSLDDAYDGEDLD
jgi:hypothetical protein